MIGWLSHCQIWFEKIFRNIFWSDHEFTGHKDQSSIFCWILHTIISSVLTILIHYTVNFNFNCNELYAERVIHLIYQCSKGNRTHLPFLFSPLDSRTCTVLRIIGCVLGVRNCYCQGDKIKKHIRHRNIAWYKIQFLKCLLLVRWEYNPSWHKCIWNSSPGFCRKGQWDNVDQLPCNHVHVKLPFQNHGLYLSFWPWSCSIPLLVLKI